MEATGMGIRIARWAFVLIFGCVSAWAGDTVTQPFPGVTYVCHEQQTPQPLAHFLVRIDLTTPGLRFTSTPSNSEDPYETKRQTTLEFVKQTGAQIGINANWFTLDTGANADLFGLAVSEGHVVSPWDGSDMKYGVNIGKDNTVTFVERAKDSGTETIPPVPLYTVVSGRYRLVHEGKVEPGLSVKERHPRTALGMNANREILLFIVDGRSKKHSVGMTLQELAEALFTAGAVEAIDLDGGGSATLVLANPEPHVENIPLPLDASPSASVKPPGIQRENGNNLAVFIPPDHVTNLSR
jgi:hypothetical protein